MSNKNHMHLNTSTTLLPLRGMVFQISFTRNPCGASLPFCSFLPFQHADKRMTLRCRIRNCRCIKTKTAI